MSLLTDTKWPVSYRREDGDLVALFYNPALAPAVQYDRTTGYFSASALAVAAHGIDALIQNDGRMRLIVGCTLNAAEQKAIGKGYDLRAALEERLASIPLEPPDDQSRSALGMLAWMVSQGHLDVKVAVPVDPEGSPTVSTGLYHEKVGVITDRDGNRVSFSGSINETAAGWIHNAESFHVHCSWMGERELEHVEAEVDSFARLWDGKTRSVRVFEFPEALRGKLLEFLPQSDRFVSPPPLQRKELPPPDRYRLMPEEFRRIVWTFLEAAPGLENGIRAGEFTSAVSPWPHQIRTYTGFLKKWPWRLLIADEVGLGKTISAGLILRQALLSGLAKRILLLVPKSVLIQWQNELYEKFNLNVPIYDGACLCWRKIGGTSAGEELSVARNEWQWQPIVLCSSYLMRRADRQKEITGEHRWDLVVLDEAHHARRRGAGSAQERGPNALLGVMRELKDRCDALLLLTATPMQVHPVEIWDLLLLLGLPPSWAHDDSSVERYFGITAGGNPSHEEMETVARFFQDTEKHFGELTDEELAATLPDLSPLNRRKILKALRETSSIRRKQMSASDRRSACKLLQAASPLRHRMVRNTRGLLRRYAKEGRLKLPIAEREPCDIAVAMTAADAALYRDVEDFISDTYTAADQAKRSAVGFVMTVYRRRLASSFAALKKTMVNRLRRVGGMEDADTSQDETGDEVMTSEAASQLAEEALAFEEKGRIQQILKAIEKLGTDSKALRLREELQNAFTLGHESAIIFTQYTDTMEYLRDFVADHLTGFSVASYSGSGGAYRDGAGGWVPCSKEEIKRRLKSGQIRLLVCSDAASEGLNLQFASVLVNYDLPWNPMRVEQRIGRIDRLGQKNPKVLILNFAYQDTVEEDVFFQVGNRINLFQGIVGRLQPILSRLPKRLEELSLRNRETREIERQRFIAELREQVDEPGGFDLDEASTDSLDLPPLPEPPISLEGMDRVLQTADAAPTSSAIRPLDLRSYGVLLPGREEARVTTSADVFDQSSDSQQLFSPGGDVFTYLAKTDIRSEIGEGAENIDSVAWNVRQADDSSCFAVQTESGLEWTRNIEELLDALARVGRPCRFPFAAWPGVLAKPLV